MRVAFVHFVIRPSDRTPVTSFNAAQEKRETDENWFLSSCVCQTRSQTASQWCEQRRSNGFLLLLFFFLAPFFFFFFSVCLLSLPPNNGKTVTAASASMKKTVFLSFFLFHFSSLQFVPFCAFVRDLAAACLPRMNEVRTPAKTGHIVFTFLCCLFSSRLSISFLCKHSALNAKLNV